MILLMIEMEKNADYRDFLTELYNEHRQRMFCYAYTILNDKGLAEDAVNQAFVGIINNVERVFSLDVKKIDSYIVISVRNACYNILKKRNNLSKYEFLSEKIDEGVFYDYNTYLNSSDFSYVGESLNVLSERSKNVVLLKYFAGCTYKEISEIMNISVDQVGVILKRAKIRLKKEILTKRNEYEKK